MHRTSRGRPASPPDRSTVEVGADRLTTATWGDGPPSVVMLHDGLGSIAQWRDVPARLAARTGLTVLAYDRAGHGSSTPVPTRALAGRLAAPRGPGAGRPARRGRRRGPGARRPLRRRVDRRHPRRRSADDRGRSCSSPPTPGWRRRRRARSSGCGTRPTASWPRSGGSTTSRPPSSTPGRGCGRATSSPAGTSARLVGTVQAPVLVVQGEGDEFASAEHATTFAAIDRRQRRVPAPARPRPQPPPRGSRPWSTEVAGSFITARHPLPSRQSFHTSLTNRLVTVE